MNTITTNQRTLSMSATSEAIEILQGALTLADFLENEEREQVIQRLVQLRRREEDPRKYIAFVGEKKAGKSSLLRLLTGVPLPTAVRECTAAICMLQAGMDWYHSATMGDGQHQHFEPINDADQQRRLRLARKKDRSTAENAISRIEAAELQIEAATEAVDLRETEIGQAIALIAQCHTERAELDANAPWLWSWFKSMLWLGGSVRRHHDALVASDEEIEQANQALIAAQQAFEKSKSALKEIESTLPEAWGEARELAKLSRADIEVAKIELQEIARQNKEKFDSELQGLIDMAYDPAERVEILSPDTTLPFDVVLLDTPGFNTEQIDHRRRAWEAIEEMADVCILVSDIRQPMPDSALQMLRRIAPFCPYMHVALTKSDLALEEASNLMEDPEAEVRDARAVAQSRIEPYWDDPMSIWVVDSVGDGSTDTIEIFSSFWTSIPEQAREVKSKKLGALAITEMIDILEIHSLLQEEKRNQFEDVTQELRRSLLTDLNSQTAAFASQTSRILKQLEQELQDHLNALTQNWKDRIEACGSKSDIKRCLEKLQLALDSETKKMSAAADTALHVGIQQSSTTIWTQKEPIDGYHSRLLPDIPETEQREDISTAQEGIGLFTLGAGGAAGVLTGWTLTGSLAIPLMLVVGAGGIASLLLSPLAEAKSNALDSLDSSHRQFNQALSQKCRELSPKVAIELHKVASESLSKDFDQRRSQQKEELERHLERIRHLQSNLEKSKISYLLNTSR